MMESYIFYGLEVPPLIIHILWGAGITLAILIWIDVLFHRFD